MAPKLDGIVRSYLPKIVQSVCESVRIPSLYREDGSGFPYGMDVAAAADHAMSCARGLGFRVRDLGGKVCWAEYGESAEGEGCAAAMGHLDIVPPGDGWSFDPFCGTVRSGYILGRGTQDDKGPLFSSLYALKAVADLGVPLRRQVRVIFGMDEESGRMRDVEAYLASEKPPLLAFTPDGAYPVVNAEKGSVKFRAEARFADSGAEALRLESLRAGHSLGAVPAHAEAVLGGERKAVEAAAALMAESAHKHKWQLTIHGDGGQLFVSVEGKAAHATLPSLGSNAAGRLFVLLAAAGVSGEAGAFIRFMAEKFGVESDGASLGIKASHPHCGDLTVNLAMAEGGADRMAITCGVYLPAQTISFDEVCGTLRKNFEEAGASFTPISSTKPFCYEPDHPLIAALCRGYGRATGKEARLVSMCGGTYAKKMPNMTPYGATFDGEDDRAHGADERVLISNLLESTRLMAYALLEMAQ